MHTKTLEQLTLDELATIHLDTHGNPRTLADGYIESGMGHLVSEIQQSLPRTYTGFFSPLYGAFALLDQIGEIYVNKALPNYGNNAASGIKKALYYFGGMQINSAEVQAIYGLRNALMHNGSLLYRGRLDVASGQWEGPFHHFRWNKTLTSAIQLPSTPWNGDLNSFHNSIRTEINVAKICELAISSVERAKSAHKAGNLEINIVGGCQELYYRYLYFKRN
jgi:hypothetical protein